MPQPEEEDYRIRFPHPAPWPQQLSHVEYDDGFTDGSPYGGTHEVWVSDGNGGLKKVDRPNNSFD